MKNTNQYERNSSIVARRSFSRARLVESRNGHETLSLYILVDYDYKQIRGANYVSLRKPALRYACATDNRARDDNSCEKTYENKSDVVQLRVARPP